MATDEQAARGADQQESPPDKRSELRANRDKLTQKKIKIGKKQVHLTKLSIGVALVGIFVAAVIAVPSWGGGGTATSGVCSQVGRDELVCNVTQELQGISDQDPNEENFKAKLKGISQGPPSPSGPWPYAVFNTIDSHGIDIGLKVRAGPELRDSQVGSASRRAIVWAECVVTNTFDPEPDTGIGPTWLRIHWPNNSPTTQYFQSSPTDIFRAYVYAGYVLPFKHNGDIPRC